MGCLGSVDIENEIGTMGVDLIVECELEFDSDHAEDCAAPKAHRLWSRARTFAYALYTITTYY